MNGKQSLAPLPQYDLHCEYDDDQNYVVYTSLETLLTCPYPGYALHDHTNLSAIRTYITQAQWSAKTRRAKSEQVLLTVTTFRAEQSRAVETHVSLGSVYGTRNKKSSRDEIFIHISGSVSDAPYPAGTGFLAVPIPAGSTPARSDLQAVHAAALDLLSDAGRLPPLVVEEVLTTV